MRKIDVSVHEVTVLRTMSKVFGFAAGSLFLAICCFGSSATASIYTVSPGTGITASPSAFPAGGTVVGNLSFSFTSSTIDGTVTSTVISGDTLNPYGGLTFEYLLTLSGNSTDSASEMTAGSYAGFLTDVSYNPTVPSGGGGIAPSNFSRSGSVNNGDTLRFLWFNNNISPDQTGDLIVVQTSAQNFHGAVGGVIDSQTANVNILAPALGSIPEPAVGGLVAMGLGLLFVLRRHTSK